MLRRPVQLLVALWWFSWVFVIIPCHTRGAIPIGPDCPDCRADNIPLFFGTIPPTTRSCCSKKNHLPASPNQKSSTNCAICQLVATTPNPAPPPPLHIFLALSELLPPVTPAGATHFVPLLTHQSRAPPIA